MARKMTNLIARVQDAPKREAGEDLVSGLAAGTTASQEEGGKAVHGGI
jgi:hypothetical protein